MVVASKGLKGEWDGQKVDSFRSYNEYGSNYPVPSRDLGCGTLMRILKGKVASGSKSEQNRVFGLIHDSTADGSAFGFTYRTLPSICPFLDDSSLIERDIDLWSEYNVGDPCTPVVFNLNAGFILGWGLGDCPANPSSRWKAPHALLNYCEDYHEFCDDSSHDPLVAEIEPMAKSHHRLTMCMACPDNCDNGIEDVWELCAENHGSEWGLWDCCVYCHAAHQPRSFAVPTRSFVACTGTAATSQCSNSSSGSVSTLNA